PPELPAAVALVNPKRAENHYPEPELASGGLAFKVMAALHKSMGRSWDAERYIDLVALSTVCDVAPLQHETRTLVRQGVAVLGRTADLHRPRRHSIRYRWPRRRTVGGGVPPPGCRLPARGSDQPRKLPQHPGIRHHRRPAHLPGADGALRRPSRGGRLHSGKREAPRIEGSVVATGDVRDRGRRTCARHRYRCSPRPPPHERQAPRYALAARAVRLRQSRAGLSQPKHRNCRREVAR